MGPPATPRRLQFRLLRSHRNRAPPAETKTAPVRSSTEMLSSDPGGRGTSDPMSRPFRTRMRSSPWANTRPRAETSPSWTTGTRCSMRIAPSRRAISNRRDSPATCKTPGRESSGARASARTGSGIWRQGSRRYSSGRAEHPARRRMAAGQGRSIRMTTEIGRGGSPSDGCGRDRRGERVADRRHRPRASTAASQRFGAIGWASTWCMASEFQPRDEASTRGGSIGVSR